MTAVEASEPSAAFTGRPGGAAHWLASVAPRPEEAERPASLAVAGVRAGLGAAETGGCTVVFDGVLFERDDLARRLAGDAGVARSDAALILDAYRRWGAAFLEEIKGIFSLALWDAADGALLAARDPVGTIPLCYAQTPAAFVASPSLAALLAHPGVPPDVNRVVVAEHLYHRWLRRDETYYAAIRRLPPGHLLHVRRGTVRISRYRDRFPEGSPIDWATERDVERFDDLMTRAVRRCLTGPAGLNLSGGLDSVTVAAIAAEESRRMGLPALRAFSLAFPDPISEAETQRSVAAQLGLPLTMMSLDEAAGPRGILAGALEMSAARPTPLINFWAPAYRRLGIAAGEQGCEVILTGNGGDDWLTVTPVVAADLLRGGQLVEFYRFWRMWHRSFPLTRVAAARIMWRYGAAPVLRGVAIRALQRSAPPLLHARRSRSVRTLVPPYIAPDPAFRAELYDRLLGHYRPPSPEGFYVEALRRASVSPIVVNELEDTWTTGQTLRARLAHPFWDVDLTELLFRTPPHLLNKGGRSKSLVRRTLARRFPTLGFERQRKLGATSYLNDVLASQGPPAWQALGGATCLSRLGIVDPRRLDEVMLSRLQSGHTTKAFQMWYVLGVESWLRGRPASATR